MLIEHLSTQPILGAYELEIKGDPRKKRTGRMAKMLIKLSPVIVTVRDKEVGLYVVEAKEDPSTIPEGQKGIHWRLLTTHTVENMEQAQMILNWYAMRWNIEQLFRLIKQKGLNVEDSDMETGKALIQLILMSLYAASKILLLHLASKEQEPQPIKQTFTAQEIECLTAVNARYEGKTIAYAEKIIAAIAQSIKTDNYKETRGFSRYTPKVPLAIGNLRLPNTWMPLNHTGANCCPLCWTVPVSSNRSRQLHITAVNTYARKRPFEH